MSERFSQLGRGIRKIGYFADSDGVMGSDSTESEKLGLNCSRSFCRKMSRVIYLSENVKMSNDVTVLYKMSGRLFCKDLFQQTWRNRDSTHSSK